MYSQLSVNKPPNPQTLQLIVKGAGTPSALPLGLIFVPQVHKDLTLQPWILRFQTTRRSFPFCLDHTQSSIPHCLLFASCCHSALHSEDSTSPHRWTSLRGLTNSPPPANQSCWSPVQPLFGDWVTIFLQQRLLSQGPAHSLPWICRHSQKFSRPRRDKLSESPVAFLFPHVPNVVCVNSPGLCRFFHRCFPEI